MLLHRGREKMEGQEAFDREQAMADYLGYLLSEYKAGRMDSDDYYKRLLTVLEAWQAHDANLQQLTSYNDP